MTDINNICVIGAGTMGSGIASSFITNGFSVFHYDVSDLILERSRAFIYSNIDKLVKNDKIDVNKSDLYKKNYRLINDLNDLNECYFIIEAAIEDITIKRDIFRKLNYLNKDTVIASNTSSIPIASLSVGDEFRSRYIGMHFFNPANIMKLVEIVVSKHTSEETIKKTIDIAKRSGKVPVICKDTPAFIVNRIARSFYGESLKILGEENSGHELIDKIMKEEGGFRMGPFELMDLIGIDVNYQVTKSVYESFYNDQKYKPHFIQKSMVDSGELGKKTGKGFYDYSNNK